MSSPEYLADPDLPLHLIQQLPDVVGEFLARATIFLAARDAQGHETRLAGSGVVADVLGMKVVLTAGHVLRDFRRDFEDGRVILSVNQPKGSFTVRPDAERLVSPGGDMGADAGVLIIPPDQVETYFQFGGFQPVRASTLRVSLPPSNVAHLVAGFAANGTKVFSSDNENGRSWFHATLSLVGARRLESDAVHHWLDASTPTAGTDPLVPGEFKGMSGCGFWSFESMKDPTTNEFDVRACLHGVHTATVQAEKGTRLRQTPISHHLRLLADHSESLRGKLSSLWPEPELGSDAARRRKVRS